jgi:DNA repair exonuclease SbcCD nuclease subunit
MKIIHVSDTHLGRRRLDGRLPDEDFFKAFSHIASEAVKGKADVMLITGDFFDRAQVEPPHLRQAQQALAILKQAGIPVVAIEGNHDRVSINGTDPTWLSFLGDDQLMILLKVRFDQDGAILTPWDPASRTGAFHDVDGVRFVGAGYLGAATPNKMRQITEELDAQACNVILLHAGPDYFVGEGGGFSPEDLKAIRTKVRYLALGHIHKPMVYEEWACNPGSPENCELHESKYDLNRKGQPQDRGYAWVEIDPGSPDSPAVITLCSNPRRPCLHLELDCTPFGNKTKNGTEALGKAALETIRDAAPPPEAVVNLRLSGKVNLGRVQVDGDLLAASLCKESGVTAVAIDPSGLNLDGMARGASGGSEGLSREELERQALKTLVGKDPLWNLHEDDDQFVDLFFSLKEAVRAGKSSDEHAETILNSPLVAKVRQALVAPGAVAEAAAGTAATTGDLQAAPGGES